MWNMLNEAKIACIVEMTAISKNTDFLLPCSLEIGLFDIFEIAYERFKPYKFVQLV